MNSLRDSANAVLIAASRFDELGDAKSADAADELLRRIAQVAMGDKNLAVQQTDPLQKQIDTLTFNVNQLITRLKIVEQALQQAQVGKANVPAQQKEQQMAEVALSNEQQGGSTPYLNQPQTYNVGNEASVTVSPL